MKHNTLKNIAVGVALSLCASVALASNPYTTTTSGGGPVPIPPGSGITGQILAALGTINTSITNMNTTLKASGQANTQALVDSWNQALHLETHRLYQPQNMPFLVIPS